MTIRIKSEKDFWAGVMFVAFGLFFALFALGTPEWLDQIAGRPIVPGYHFGSAVRMGPAYFPAVLGGMLAALGAGVLLGSLASRRDPAATRLKLPFTLLDGVIVAAIFVASVTIAEQFGWANDYALLAATVVVAVLTVLFRPDARPLVLILAGCLVYGYLMKPLGLIVATAALVFVSALGGHEFRWKEVALLYLVLIVFSILVFVKGLTLPFPICPDFVPVCPIR